MYDTLGLLMKLHIFTQNEKMYPLFLIRNYDLDKENTKLWKLPLEQLNAKILWALEFIQGKSIGVIQDVIHHWLLGQCP